jgi:hypothetical protein
MFFNLPDFYSEFFFISLSFAISERGFCQGDNNNVNRVQENISKRPGSWSSWL